MNELREANRRKVLKTIGVGAVGGTVLTGQASAGHNVATADLRPINDDAAGNEVSGHLRIEDGGDPDDGGSGLAVSGSAEGMDPGNDTISINAGPCGDSVGYISLFYDKGSSPNGPEACEPGPGIRSSLAARATNGAEGDRDDHPLDLTIPEMHAAKWSVDGDGNGTARRMNVIDVTFPTFDDDGNFDRCVTASIPKAYVEVDRIGTVSIRDARINDGFGPDAVVACGKVTHEGKGNKG